MTRRPTSSSRRRSASAKNARTDSGRKPTRGAASNRAAQREAATSGAVTVGCPQCGQQYRVPAAQLDQKLKCNNCQRSFFPKAAAGRRRSGRNQSTPFIVGGVVLVAVVGIFIVIANLPPSQVAMAKMPEVVQKVNIGFQSPRVQDVARWADAVHSGDALQLTRVSDTDALQTALGLSGRPISELTGEEASTAKAAFLEALTTSEQTRVFRDFQTTDGRLETEAMASSETGAAVLELLPRDGSDLDKYIRAENKRHEVFSATVRVSFRVEDDVARVTGFEVVDIPPSPKPKKPRFVPHAEIEKPVEVERVIDGEKQTVVETELIPLGHLEDTPEDVRRAIDAEIDRLRDLDAPGRFANQAIDALREIGRPAVPRLLNQMFEMHQGGMRGDDKLRLRRMIQALTAMSGMRFSFNVADNQKLTADGNAEQRESALKQWYAWWYRVHAGDFTNAIDKEDDEDLFLTDEEKRARAEARKAAGGGS